MGAQPVIAKDEVSVAVHVKLHEGSVLVETTKDQPGLHRASRWP